MYRREESHYAESYTVAMGPIQLIIFDFDGVLVDTERTTFDFYRQILPEYGVELQESDFSKKVGRKSVDFLRDVLGTVVTEEQMQSLIQQKRRAFLEDIPRYLTLIPNSFAFLERCSHAGIPMAIGSQNERELLERAVDAFDLRKYFRLIVSLQDIRRKKPDPEIFLLIIKELGANPSATLVIEDSVHGVEAARRAGCHVVAITTASPAEAFPHAHSIVGSLADVALP